jgi:hypothetical protein
MAWSRSLMKPTFQRIAVASALCLGLAASAAAQDRPAGPGGPQAQGPHRGGDRQPFFTQMRQRREQRLHDLLQIKSDQEPAFRTFVASLEQLRPPRGPGQTHGQGAPDQGARGPGAGQRMPLTAPERLDRMARRMAERQQRLQKETAAVKTFYAALTPGQRKVFDMTPMMLGGGHGGGPGGHMWRHGGFGGPAPGR